MREKPDKIQGKRKSKELDVNEEVKNSTETEEKDKGHETQGEKDEGKEQETGKILMSPRRRHFPKVTPNLSSTRKR